MPSETVAQIPRVVLSPADIAHLTAHKGVLSDPLDASRYFEVLTRFESASLAVVWEYSDTTGYFGGNTELLGRAHDGGPWRRLHPYVWAYLSDLRCGIDPAVIPSLLEGVPYGVQGIENLHGDGDGNYAHINGGACQMDAFGCPEDMPDSSFRGGFCGFHNRLIEAHEAWGHRRGNDACPSCIAMT